MKTKSSCPLHRSKYMGRAEAQIPIRITDKMIRSATYRLESVDKNCGYQAEAKYHAARRWVHGLKRGEYVWAGIAGAATPVGLGGLLADAIAAGLIDAIICTGANAYHDLHFACGLPVKHGSHQVNDTALCDDGTTRIYTQFIHNEYTLKMQDTINQYFCEKFLRDLRPSRSAPPPESPVRNSSKRLPMMEYWYYDAPTFSTATLLNKLGQTMLEDTSGIVVNKKGSFVLRAAEYDVPIFLDSGSNHSLGMDLSLLYLKGFNADTSPSKDVIEATATSIFTQPQLNVFVGEGGPRNLIQTTPPMANEVCGIDFIGSDAGCILFTTADARTGGLSGCTKDEGKTWKKYTEKADEVSVWGEYTLTFPDVLAYVAGKVKKRPKRLFKRMDRMVGDFLEMVRKNDEKLIQSQQDLWKVLPAIQKVEIAARKKAARNTGKNLYD